MTTDTAKLQTITTLYSGAHNSDGKHCVMEAVSFVAGEKWTDKPECACPVLAAFARVMNDSITNDALRTRLLLPLVSVLVGSKSTPAVEQQRAALLARWAVRVIAPIALRAVKLDTEADKLAALPEDVDLAAARAAAGDARDDVWTLSADILRKAAEIRA